MVQHEDNSIVDLPLPPPPSPTQLQQYENQTYLNTVVAPNASTSILVSSSQVDKVRDSINSNCNSHCTTITNATNEMFTTMATMPSNITSADNGDKPFEYVTLTGNVIRSVVPPGKGANVNYKVSQGYVRPFGAAPAATTPKSPVIYPPQPQQWSASAPPPTQPKPISNPYATLPRSNVGQQEPPEQSLQPQHAETYFEDDYEVEQANRQSRVQLLWPPPEDENRRTPTATPLYIAPPGTQHVAVKPLEEKPAEKSEQSIMTSKQLSSCSENQESTQCQWQSRSAPQLTNAAQHTECESGSDSYTSTSTTTTTTSEEYQRMYAAQVHAYQMQQLYEQSGSDFDYHMDMEVAAMQQRQQEHDEHLNLTSAEYLSGRRSAQECAETLAPSLNTFKLVDMVREVTPSPVPQSNNQAPRHVAFVDKPEVKEVDLIPEQLNEGKEDNESNSVAPERSFEGHFDRDVPIHLLDLPTPKERLTLTDALATAPERPYTPLNPENATHMFEEKQKEQEKKKSQFQVLDREEELGLIKETAMEFYTTERKQSKAFAAMQAFQCSREPLSSADPPKHSMSYAKDETDLEFQKYCSAHERYHKRRDYFTQKEQELQEQLKQQQPQQTNITTTQQTNKRDESTLYSSAKQSSSTNSSSAVQQMSIRSYASSNLTQEQKSSYSFTNEPAAAKTVSSNIDTQEIIQETAEDLEHSEVIFPPPSPLSHMKQKATLSGLHRPETLPKYQRNWTILPTQSPVRTPEPPELRENVPLAFVDTPKIPRAADGIESNAVHKPVAQLCAKSSASSTVAQSSITSASTVSNYQQRVSEQRQQQSENSETSKACMQHTASTNVPIIIEDRSGPVTMAFQSIDEHLVRDESQTPSRPYTPASFTNKPAPIIPPYQTPEKLCFDECAPTHGKLYDRRSVSPFPDRARSPAPGPPPNPLAAIRAPRLRDEEMAPVSQRMLQAGSITTGQSYLGAQQAKQQGELLAYTETSSQSAMQSYIEKPEKRNQLQVGSVMLQKSEKESRLEEQKQTQLESHTKTQMGNVQIERRRKVTEEFEHTSSAKTIEIRTGSQNTTSERRQSYGKTGYVANQAKRLSGLEEEISNLTSQSQAISARAANLTETKFPEVHDEGGAAQFPSKPMLPSYSESKTASYVVSGTPDSKMVSSFAGKTMQHQEHMSNVHEASVVSAKQQQQKSLSAYSSNISSSVASCSQQQQQQQRQANAVSCNLTKASATNQAYAASAATNQYTSTASGTTPQNVCPITGALCGPRDTCCKSRQPMQTSSVNNYNNNYRPNASAGLTGFKAPQTTATSFATPQSVMQAPLTSPAPATTAAPASTNYNIGSNVADGSSGGMASKGGAYGATSAPKRGRGIINKAVGPGVRVPLCNSCNTQIR
uniref:Uncharacterized protein n=1 Tax=Glossina austeni TaxID=7395 RepID=A0A1A9VT85_GLOAU